MTSYISYAFAVEGMHCASCGLLIDDALLDLPGVSESTTSVKTETCIVTADPAQCTPEDVTAAITDLGYRARLTERTPT